MIIIVIILSYIANVFLNRYIDYFYYKKYNVNPTIWSWFLGPFYLIVFFMECFLTFFRNFKNFDIIKWFTGKNW